MMPTPEPRTLLAGGTGGRHRGHVRVLRTAALIAALAADAVPARAQFTLPTDFVDELVIPGLPQVVGMAFVPDGRLLVIERATARVRLIVNGALGAVDPVVTVPDVIASYGEEGLLGIAVDPVATVEFRAPFPSPSQGAVSFEYALPAEGPVALVIYDPGGRRVREVFGPESQGPGPRRAIWDGRDHTGRDAGAGVYVAALTVGGERFERRFALVR